MQCLRTVVTEELHSPSSAAAQANYKRERRKQRKRP
eukprot:CAMPEP_0170389464 /NCGR_PEP_ID=MMETSP0117_2-20130122/18631_1 /TAXON_ID=400756 /ORGANISM="Durinskia baltica, Strain CSIRO CS-38" /LENGTH=35 /DNA_ID= /DNA_START= /DNA_END= /DNA_ORIENTATION=